jgi:hypothetical protein
MKTAMLAAISLLLLLSAGCDSLGRPDPLDVERSSIVVGEVKRGDFMLRQGGDGVLKPDQMAEVVVSLTNAQVDDVHPGQPAVVKIGDAKVSGKVTKIDPPERVGENQVNRRVTVALSAVPNDAKPGAAVEGRIDVMPVKDALYITRPALAPAQTLLYRLNADQTTAAPVKVEYGRLGIEYAEILSGLSLGDHVIVSITAQYEASGPISLR